MKLYVRALLGCKRIFLCGDITGHKKEGILEKWSQPHMETAFFTEGGNNFSVCTWLKNAFSGGDAFGCHCLCERGGGGETQFSIHRKKVY